MTEEDAEMPVEQKKQPHSQKQSQPQSQKHNRVLPQYPRPVAEEQQSFEDENIFSAYAYDSDYVEDEEEAEVANGPPQRDRKKRGISFLKKLFKKCVSPHRAANE